MSTPSSEQPKGSPATVPMTRRRFIGLSGCAAGAAAAGLAAVPQAFADDLFGALPVVLFSKLFQELKLGYEDAAACAAEAGLDGLDCPVRPGGEVLPERVKDDLPAYVAALKRRHLSMPLITTAIVGPATPHTETVLRTAKALGVSHYRLGFQMHQTDTPLERQISEIRDRLKDLAALNREIGITAIFQNHSPGGRKYAGGDLGEMRRILDGFNPLEVGMAFDIGHALVVHGAEWGERFDALRPHIAIAYVKDPTAANKWVALGQGRVGETDYLKRLKQLKYRQPISLHIEYDWHQGGKNRTREQMVKAVRANLQTLKRWLVEA